MDLYYSGAEQPIYLRKLYELGVRKVAISFFEWQRRHSSDDLYRHIPEDVQVCVTAGIARKEDIDFKAFGRDYVEFCEQNAEDALIYDMDSAHCPLTLRKAIRRQLSILPNVVVFPVEEESPNDLAVEFERIGINASLGKSIPPAELRRIGGTLYGSNITDPRKLREGKFAATVSSAWMGPIKFGELWVFSRNKLSHYKADSLVRAVRAHSAEIEAYGVDPAACAVNDTDALVSLAVLSLQAMADSLSKRRRDNENVEAAAASPMSANQDRGTPEPTSPTEPGQEIVPITSEAREQIVLPIISVNDLDGVRKVQLSPASLRQCDNCDLSQICSGYEPHAVCKFSVPVEIKTREQWEAASQVLLEAQFQRTMFGAFSEQVDGGSLTPRVGQEMDRFFKMLTAIKDLETSPDDGADGPMTRFFRNAVPPGTGDDHGEAGEEGDEYEDAEIIDDDKEDGEIQYSGDGNAFV